jgi:hypothetical protein
MCVESRNRLVLQCKTAGVMEERQSRIVILHSCFGKPQLVSESISQCREIKSKYIVIAKASGHEHKRVVRYVLRIT